jgi:hypothetical protein
MFADTAERSLHINAYPGSRGFQFPAQLAALLGLKSPDEIAMTVMRPSGDLLFHGITQLSSGTEITSVEVCGDVQPGEELRITASRPPK